MPNADEVAKIIDPDGFRRASMLVDYALSVGMSAEDAVKHVNLSLGRRIDKARQKANDIMELFLAERH